MSDPGLKPRWLRLRARFVIFVLSGVAVVATAMALISHWEASSALLESSQEQLLDLASAQAGSWPGVWSRSAPRPWTWR